MVLHAIQFPQTSLVRLQANVGPPAKSGMGSAYADLTNQVALTARRFLGTLSTQIISMLFKQ
jgi:hypothetical protein